MSTAIDDLRSMLDERHVKWRTDTSVTNKVEWTIWKSPWFKEVWAKEVDGSISIFNCSMTPAQAVEATLGNDGAGRTDDGVADRGTCSRESRRPMAEYVYGTDGHEGHWLTGEEIVRCRDCKHFEVDQSDHEYRSGWWCKRWDTDMVKPDGFCAWGERRDDGREG